MIKEFEYFAPKTIEEALALLSKYKNEAAIVAGGQSLLLVIKQGLIQPSYVIGIKGITTLEYIKFDEKHGLRIGALTPHRALEKSSIVQKEFSAFAEVEAHAGSVQIRNWGTIGGNLCFSSPAHDPPAILIAMSANAKIASSRGERGMPLELFFTGYRKTALQADEMLTEIHVPKLPPNTGVAYQKFTLREEGLAVVGVAASITLDSVDGKCKDARIALSSVAPIPLKADGAAKMLLGKRTEDNVIEEAAQIASEEAVPISDIRASEGYRRELVKVYVGRVLRQALERARGANFSDRGDC